MKIKMFIFAIVIAVSTQSCIGSFNAFNKLKDWNMEVSDERWVNEAVFVGLNIIPVYGLFLLGDMLIFNSVEFWSGDNPITMEEGDCEEQWVDYEGKKYRITAHKNEYVIDEFGSDNQVVETGVLKYKPKSMKWVAKKGAKSMDIVKILPQTMEQEKAEIVLLPGTEKETVYAKGDDITETREEILNK